MSNPVSDATQPESSVPDSVNVLVEQLITMSTGNSAQVMQVAALGEVIKKRRRQLRMTRKNLAEHLGLKEPAIILLENGLTYKDTLDAILPKLAERLGMEAWGLQALIDTNLDRDLEEILDNETDNGIDASSDDDYGPGGGQLSQPKNLILEGAS